MEENKMFCYQCEQTAKGTGCTIQGVCGKAPDVSALQDLLVYALKGLALYAQEGRKLGVRDKEADAFTSDGLFAVITNANFDPQRFNSLIRQCVTLREI
jgi:hydroxylamine reductase